MYPFPSTLRWHLQGRPQHLLRILRDTPLPPELHGHPPRIRRWSRIRSVLMALLSLGLVATLAALATSYVPGLADVQRAIRLAAAWAGTFSSVLAAATIVANRTLSLLEVDVLGGLAANRAQRECVAI